MGDMFDDDNDDIIDSIRCEIQREIPTLSQLKEHLSDEIADPEIKILSNFRRLSLEQLDTFNVDTGLFEIPDQEGEEPAMKMQRNVHVRRSYHYKIGQYEMSPYYVNYLIDKIIQIPSAHTDTVCNQTLRLSLNAKSAFHLT